MSYVWQRWLADALRAEGCKVSEVSGWENRGRPASTGGFDPQGSTWHHTATHASYADPNPTLNMIINGRSDLPGPLAQVLIGYDGKCHVVAAGRANHAGDNDGFGPYSKGDGNSQSFGWEIDYDGTQPMSPEQKDAAARCSAAVAKKKGTSVDWVVIHKETSTTGKWDTGGVPGDTARKLTKQQLSAGGGGGGLDDVGLDDPITDWSPDDGTAPDKTTVGKTLNQARGYAEDAYQRVVKLQEKVNDLEQKVDKILKAVT